MLVALFARVLGQIVLILCFAAGMAASCIIFVLYGPVPVRRKVAIIPRVGPPDPFAPHRAAALVALPAIASLKQQVAPGVAFVMPSEPTRPPPMTATHAPPPMPAKKVEPLVTPLVLRRPRGESPPPLPRTRSARGTERGPRPSELDITAVRTLDDTAERTFENTLETPTVSYDADDELFVEDGR